MKHSPPFLPAISMAIAISAMPWCISAAEEEMLQNKPVQSAVSQNFRVTISVFDAKEDTLIDQHLVVFDKSMVYDFGQGDDTSVTVFDLTRNRIILLNRDAQLRSTINTEDLTNLIAQIRATADEKAKEHLGINAATELIEDKYVVRFENVTYFATTQSPNASGIALAFGQFADWASRLNAARQRGLPPFARMSLNKEVAQAGKLPNEIELEVKRGRKTQRFRSTHELIEQISEKDRKQIAEVGGMLTLYREVSLKAFP